jgi:alkylation response protein AidB-like acyl-CoA dehydrogenase
MDFELSEDQVALQDGVRSFCDGRFPIAVVRGLADSAGVDRARWRELADLGLFSLRLSEADGGAGLGWADTVVAFEELGRALVPGPLVWTHLLADRIDGAAVGDVVISGLERSDPSGIIEFPQSLDQLVVLDDEGVWSIDPASLQTEPVETLLDPLTPVSRLTADLPQGDRIGDAAAAGDLRRQGAALSAALELGLAEAATDLAVAYAKERHQFGRPVGAFQALKHLMADMFVRAELARSAAYAAGVTLDDPSVGSVTRAVASAKVTAGEAALGNAKTCIQVHGGMGYTWEIDAHLLLKRAYVLEASFGTRDDWSDILADLVAAAG